jgi:hypothetical protein
MKLYAKTYGDFTIVDGTHSTTAYDLKLMPFTNVDCFGKNVVSGILLDESENTASVAESLPIFHPIIPGATLRSDGGSAYPGVASTAGMIHILCTHHFQQDVFASCGGLGALSDDFKRDVLALVYQSFTSSEQFDLHAERCQTLYDSFPSAAASIRKVLKDKRKLCRTFTGTPDELFNSSLPSFD